MKKSIILIDKKLKKHFSTPLKAKNPPQPLDMLIATILSQNTNDQNSFKAYQNLKNYFNDWEEVKNSDIKIIEEKIKIAGLGNQKANTIKSLLDELHKNNKDYSLKNLSELNNEKSIQYLTQFKGVGVKTASCVLLFSLNKNICPVDTHVHRTLNRIGIVKTNSPDKTFFEINKNFPPKIAHSFHTNLIRLGREICKPKNYKCSICPLLEICEFDNKKFEINKKSKQQSFMLLDNI